MYMTHEEVLTFMDDNTLPAIFQADLIAKCEVAAKRFADNGWTWMTADGGVPDKWRILYRFTRLIDSAVSALDRDCPSFTVGAGRLQVEAHIPGDPRSEEDYVSISLSIIEML